MKLIDGRSTGYRGLCVLLCLALLLGPSLAFAQTTPTSGTSPIDLKLRLLKLSVKLENLERLWVEQKISYRTLKDLSTRLQLELDELTELLQTSQESLRISQEDLAISIALSESLQTRLDRLSAIFDEHKVEAQRQIVIGWITGGAIGLVVGLLLSRIF